MQEAVLLENGKEIDWIDPVISVEENEYDWIIDNGLYKYHLKKKNNRELILREKGWECE